MKRFVWLAVMAACTACASKGQSAPATLQGKVIDGTGATLSGATVSVLDGANRRFSLTTDEVGRFSFYDTPGVYDTTVTAPAFRGVHSAMTDATDATAIITLGVSQPGQINVKADAETTQPSALGTVASAQDLSAHSSWEYGALFQGGVGLTEDRGGFRFLLAGAHLGRVLTPEIGKGLVKGNFEYAVELFPYWQSFTPTFSRVKCGEIATGSGAPTICSAPYRVGGTFTGASVTPIILRWNVTGWKRAEPWVQGAGGVLWTNHKYPAYGDTSSTDPQATGPSSDTSVWNFTPQFGVGVHCFVAPRRSVDFSANAVHISSASLGDRNPGVNASVQFALGYTWWK